MEKAKIKELLAKNDELILRKTKEIFKPLFIFTIANFIIVYLCIIGFLILTICK